MKLAHPHTIREYIPRKDHPHVVEICRHVYGGRDYLPATINALAAQEGTSVLVCARDEPDGAVDALLCCAARGGGALWAWGARTSEAVRGRGLASRLFRAAEGRARAAGCAALVTTTIQENQAMLAVLERKLEWQRQAEVGIYVVPDAVGGAPEASQRWRPVASVDELGRALARLQGRRRPAAAAGLPPGAARWLPLDFAVWAAASAAVEEGVARGHVLELAAGGDEGGGLFWMATGQAGDACAGCVAGSAAALGAALARAAAAEPRPARLYADCCFDGGAGAAAEAQRYAPLPSYIVLHKLV